MDTTSHQVILELAKFREASDLQALESASDLVGSMQPGADEKLPDLRKFHQDKLILWLKVLNAIDAKLDPKFDANNTPALAVTPPPDAQVPAGADPNSIRDPKIRAEYLDSITANQEKARYYSLQYKLHRLNEQISGDVEAYVRKFHLGNAEEKTEYLQLVEKVVASPQRRASLQSLALAP